MIDLQIFGYPLSLILASVAVLCIVFLRKWLAVIIPARTLTVIVFIVLSALLAVEGVWGFGLYHHWTFVAVVVISLLLLGVTSINDFSRKSIYAFVSHSGLFLVLLGGLFGAPDSTDVLMMVDKEVASSSVPIPFNVQLQDFHIDYYDGSTAPRQYTSSLLIDGRQFRTAVNHPCRYKGYMIYQSGYDTVSQQYTVLKIVRDPWLPIVTLGALLLLLGAFLGLKTVWKNRKVLVAALSLSIVFALVSVAGISFSNLAPALRSLWFIPHLIVYMLAYSILALSVITGIASLFSKKIPDDLPGKLLSTASSLLLIGMICGAFWAKQAWGDYWTWDAKECWAAVTWLFTLAGTHASNKKTRLAFTVIAFLAMQMTWYGVNYLPSSSQSLHTYNEWSLFKPLDF